MQEVFEIHESNVRSYCRHFPAVFKKAKGSMVMDASGREYIDFFAGAGALNYGHNNPHVKKVVLDYILSDGITHSLDFFTEAKSSFISKFVETILVPRNLCYKIQFTGPTGTNAVEAALKLARKVTGRQHVVAFTNAFHGVSLGALSATANPTKRDAASVPLHYVTRMPYDNFLGEGVDTAAIVEELYRKAGAGIDKPAAFIVETVQGEGGLNVASKKWLQRIAALAKEIGALLIVDDIQCGCGRLGRFFSFEEMGIDPDIICLSKSLGGIGLPLAVTLIRPELDQWGPGEHNGTFRGNNLGFVAGAAALGYWSGEFSFGAALGDKERWIKGELEETAEMFWPGSIQVRGRGMLQGLAFKQANIAQLVSEVAFRHGVIAETCGPQSEVIKIMPPLVIDRESLHEGFERLRSAMKEVLRDERWRQEVCV